MELKDWIKAGTYVIVSLASIFVAWKANQIAGEQTQILRLQQVPSIYAEAGEGEPYDEVTFCGEGASVRHFDVTEAVFLKVEYVGDGTTAKSAMIPITDCAVESSFSNRPTGELATFTNYKPIYAVAMEADKNLRELAQSQGASGSVKVHLYFKVVYRDILGDEFWEFYDFDPLTGITIVEYVPRLVVAQLINWSQDASLADLSLKVSEVTPENSLAKWESVQERVQEDQHLQWLQSWWQQL